jgi:asparagine synthase (glutamine-hydrolysing)
VWIVFNGEIHNFRAVHAEMGAVGHAIESQSNTEILVHAYLTWGERCADRLNGVFAFAIYNGCTQSVFAARDRFGEKALYIMEREGTLYVCSELNALVQDGIVQQRTDPFALYYYFTNSCYWTEDHSPRRAQAPAWPLAEGKQREEVEHCYWSPTQPTNSPSGEHEAVTRSLELMRESVALRLVADVPVGRFLSGSVNSSAVITLASEVANRKLETFSIGFSNARFDDRPSARYVAKLFRTYHHEFVLEPSGLDIIERITWYTDEPFAASSALPTWHLSKLARQHVTVALSGNGGDEMFAGYDSYPRHLASERLHMIPRFLRRAGLRMLRSMPTSDTGIERRCCGSRAISRMRNGPQRSASSPSSKSCFAASIWLAFACRLRKSAPRSIARLAPPHVRCNAAGSRRHDLVPADHAVIGKIFRRNVLERIGEHTYLTRDWSFALWTLLMFDTWCARFDIRSNRVIT